jgi:hypothetical protein
MTDDGFNKREWMRPLRVVSGDYTGPWGLACVLKTWGHSLTPGDLKLCSSLHGRV